MKLTRFRYRVLHYTNRGGVWLLAARLAAVCLVAQGSTPAQSAKDAGPSWDHVLQLAPNVHLKISADKAGGDCLFQSASAQSLVCLHHDTTRVISRADIRSVKIAGKRRSTMIGFGLGAGLGAGVGVGVGSGVNKSDSGSLLHVSGGKAAGVGAGIGAILGGVTGAFVGYTTDMFASPVIYHR